MEDFNVTQFPEGVEKAKGLLTFLPDIPAVRDAFMDNLLYLLLIM